MFARAPQCVAFDFIHVFVYADLVGNKRVVTEELDLCLTGLVDIVSHPHQSAIDASPMVRVGECQIKRHIVESVTCSRFEPFDDGFVGKRLYEILEVDNHLDE
ncbi:hypothetical protein [Natrinema sp. SYSU A 869]|uniref:hypothetical protein n=1 Tax=Natrinema sp. SYSU A 869 TaxID=2871694 RepID=UPI001CA43EEB|nr:hypothetical protein [Natrinema sp. SYSU A 869]